MRRGSQRARYAAFMLISASASAYPWIKLMDARGYSRDKSRTRIVDFGVTLRSVLFTEANRAHDTCDSMETLRVFSAKFLQ